MQPAPIELRDYTVLKFVAIYPRLKDAKQEKPAVDGAGEIRIGFEMREANAEKPLERQVVLHATLNPAMENVAEPAEPYIHVVVEGLMVAHPAVKEEHREDLILKGGCSLLYGIIRGTIGSIMGGIPCSRVLLPTLNMYAIIDEAKKRPLNPNEAGKDAPSPAPPTG